VDAIVRRLRNRAQPGLGRLVAALCGLERVGRDARCDLARLCPAHAVSDREQGRAGDEGVLVGCPLAPRIGAVGGLRYPKH
jgi:hypothetical protein